ncbi:glutathione S-transferase [Orrella daihaiensis]|uniref:Glutathione S-transferase n=1 Tax=Orrella daihaiensis TaxID=2782176 RepID=A0ABY4APF1_9BURK|nr:glutathione S-transferase [Orrella daihaiensis]UOD50917.1 glutathione S-transferase [Orrella daihaiensis]
MHNEFDWPLLYSYRRCPYAMRARMALKVAGIHCKIIDIHLRDKPEHMLRVSPKGTVPVLCLSTDEVIDESLDIMHWALQQNDPQRWFDGLSDEQAQYLLSQTDGPFKQALDQYKYASRFPEKDPVSARESAMQALIDPLSAVLAQQHFIGGEKPVLQDIAIFPFVRQFAGVEPDWFSAHSPEAVRNWLTHWVQSDLFTAIMQKNVTHI